MALSVGLDQRAVHECSRAAMRSKLYVSPNAALSADEEPVIPSLGLFEGLQGERRAPGTDELDGAHLPSVAQCATHLQLLESFMVLREKVLKSNALDRTFSIRPILGDNETRRRNKTDPTFNTRRQKKWHIFVCLAAARFMVWWNTVDPISSRTTVAEQPTDSSVMIDEHILPLDVLMAWYSALLNPGVLKRIRKDAEYGRLFSLQFPWKAIHKAISLKDSCYMQTESAAEHFSKSTRLNPDLLAYLSNFEQFHPMVTEVLSKWANPELREIDLQSARSAKADIPHDQRCFLQICTLAVNTQLTSSSRIDILRQFDFVDRMGKQAWLRSPALDGTLNRAVHRYFELLMLFKKYPGNVFVPAPDIDLVWRTHLLSPQSYLLETSELVGHCVPYDDNISKDTFAKRLGTTEDLFRVRFGQEYWRCLCWDCEALRSALEAEKQSTHETDYETISNRVSLEVAYYRAVEIARRGKKPLPARPV